MFLLGFLCSGGPLHVYGSDLLHLCPGSRGAGLWLLTLAYANVYGETLYTQERSHSDPQVLTNTQIFYTELHLLLLSSCIHRYHALFSVKAVIMYGSAGVEASSVLSCNLFILLSLLHSFLLLSLFPF
ncbi:hypothetical protein AMECASPLE_010944 [Ameca splendens]|uniref:Uncharacterized protein n=1 Tax=Ameca splendens TaxID=208324 RepID=A0ABV0Y157_9TELE